MKFKTILKFGLPVLAVSALAVSLPLALTSCGNNSSSTHEKIVSTNKQDITNASTNLSKLETEKLGSVENAIKDESVFDSVLWSLNLSKDEVSHVNYVKQSVGVPSAKTYSTVASSEDEAEEPTTTQQNKWNVEITLKDSYKWSSDLTNTKEETINYTIDGQTLTLKNVETQFSTVGINEQKLIDNKDEIASSLNSIRDLANHASTKEKTNEDVTSEFIENFTKLVPSIPTSAFKVSLTPNVSSGSSSPTTTPETSRSEGKTQLFANVVKESDSSAQDEGNSGLSITNKNVDVKLTANTNFTLFKNSDKTTTTVSEGYSQTVEYSFINFNSLATSIVNFIKNQDVKLNESGKTIKLKVINGDKNIELPMTYNVLDPYEKSTVLGNNGTYISEFNFDLGSINFETDKLVSQIQSNLSNVFGSNAKYETSIPASVSFDEKTNKLSVQVISDVIAIDKNDIINAVNYLKRFTKSDLQSLEGQTTEKIDIRNGVMDSMGLSELISPMVNYISINSSNTTKENSDNDLTTVTLTFGINLKKVIQ